MPAKTQLTGGSFQDAEGNLLVNGYLTMKLNQDENISGVGNVCAGIEITIQLDSVGNVASSSSTPVAPDQYVWANDVMSPVNSFYRVTGYTAKGQTAFGPNNQQVTSGGTGGGTFDTGTWVPNQVYVWTPPPQPLLLQTDETNNGSQSLLDLHAGTNVALVDNGSGRVTISATFTPAPSGLPQPDISKWVLWSATAGGGGGSFDWYVYGSDATNFGGSSTVNAPTSTEGTAVVVENSTSWNGAFWIWPTRKIIFKSTCNVAFAGSSATRYWGISSIATGTGPTDPTTGDAICAGFLETGGGFGNWLLVTAIGGVATVVDSGVPVVAGTRYVIEIDVSGGTATLKINGTAIATQSSLPTANPLGLMYWQRRTGGLVDFFTDIEYNYAENAVP